MRRVLIIGCCGALVIVSACSNADTNQPRVICEDIFAATDVCLADMGCAGVLDRNLYVDQCLTEGLTSADRDAFIATSCDAVNAGACLADASFYRQRCACEPYTACPEQTSCTQLGPDTLCLDAHQHIPSAAPSCDVPSGCPTGWVCAVPSAETTVGACIQRCFL